MPEANLRFSRGIKIDQFPSSPIRISFVIEEFPNVVTDLTQSWLGSQIYQKTFLRNRDENFLGAKFSVTMAGHINFLKTKTRLYSFFKKNNIFSKTKHCPI